VSQLLYVYQVADLFRSYMDEDDKTFVDDADDLAYWLQMGHNEYRDILSQCDTELFSTFTDITVAATTYDLAGGAVKLAGPPTGAGFVRTLQRLIKVESVNAAGEHTGWWDPAQSLEELYQRADVFLLKRNLLYFNPAPTGTIRLHYIPVSGTEPAVPGTSPSPNWTHVTLPGGGVTAEDWIDDEVDKHDLIAILAYRQYAIKNGLPHAEVERQRADRVAAIQTFFCTGRNMGQNDHMQFVL